MAVYTDVSDEALTTFLKNYDVGSPIKKTPIAEGVENTNYKIETERKAFILTLFEKRTRKQDLPFFMELTAHFAKNSLPVAAPVKNRHGQYIDSIAGKPAALIEFLPGRPEMRPTPAHCKSLGAMLANLHRTVGGFTLERPNPLSLNGWRKLTEDCKTRADECAPGLLEFITLELNTLSGEWPADLPGGVVHTDLFPDNVLFEGDDIKGVIDFYFSATDSFAYDAAVCINAWCFHQGQQFAPENAQALMAAYLYDRSFSQMEKDVFPLLLRGAALRFLLTRLYDWLNQVEGAMVTVKDPLEYREIIRFHRDCYTPHLYGF